MAEEDFKPVVTIGTVKLRQAQASYDLGREPRLTPSMIEPLSIALHLNQGHRRALVPGVVTRKIFNIHPYETGRTV